MSDLVALSAMIPDEDPCATVTIEAKIAGVFMPQETTKQVGNVWDIWEKRAYSSSGAN
jgi:hypothetical protein